MDKEKNYENMWKDLKNKIEKAIIQSITDPFCTVDADDINKWMEEMERNS